LIQDKNERALVAGLLRYPVELDSLPPLRASFFQEGPARTLYASLLKLWKEGRLPAEGDDVANEVVLDLEENTLAKLGGPKAVVELASQAGARKNLVAHASKVLEAAETRDLEKLAKETEGKTAERVERLAALYKAANARLPLEQRRAVLDEPEPFSVSRLVEETQRLAEGRSSGWPSLDELEVRFAPGELAVVGARTGHGKTSFLVGLLANWLLPPRPDSSFSSKIREMHRPLKTAIMDEQVVLDLLQGPPLLVFYSHEEPEVRVFHRLLALQTAREDPSSAWTVNEVRDYLREGLRARANWPNPQVLEAAKEELEAMEGRLLVVYRPSWTVDEIAAHAKALQERANVGGVLVDYLQRIPPPAGGRYDRRDIEVSAVARRLKSLAVEVEAPVVVGAQINREAVPDGIGGKDFEEALASIRKGRPGLHNLREGGSEQEADLVLGLLNYRADFQDGQGDVPDVTPLDVGVLKNRYGNVGRWKTLDFEARYGSLRDKD